MSRAGPSVKNCFCAMSVSQESRYCTGLAWGWRTEFRGRTPSWTCWGCCASSKAGASIAPKRPLGLPARIREGCCYRRGSRVRDALITGCGTPGTACARRTVAIMVAGGPNLCVAWHCGLVGRIVGWAAPQQKCKAVQDCTADAFSALPPPLECNSVYLDHLQQLIFAVSGGSHPPAPSPPVP
jgi:hypothetical protein